MSLNHSAFQKIAREYDQRRLQHHYALQKRISEVYTAIPELEKLHQEQTSSIACLTRQAVNTHSDLSEQVKRAQLLYQKKKEQLLITHGYPKDYLEPTYTCIDCKDTGRIGKKRCHCFQQAIVDLLYTQSHVKKLIQKENFSTFCFSFYSSDYIDPQVGLSPLENIQQIVAFCKAYITHFHEKASDLLLYGNAGVGKTFLANCIAKELLDRYFTVIYLTAFEFFSILENHTFQKKNDLSESNLDVSYLFDCDLLILDDLGTELTNDFTASRLYTCINERHLNGKATVISTNLSLDDLTTRYSERVSSRIISHYQLLHVVGEDIRIKKAFHS